MAELAPLSDLLNCRLDTPQSMQMPVAMSKGQAVSMHELGLRVQQWMSALQPQPGSRWAVYHPDAFEFLAIVLALWQLQRTACVAGDNRPGTVQRLTSRVDGFAGEFPVHTRVLTEGDSEASRPAHWLKLKPDFIALEIYTSGSTGQPKPILKTIEQLESEVAVLERQWPTDSNKNSNAVVLATVSHQHLYGMTFRLFWPICSARPFERNLCEYSEDIFHLARNYEAFSLVSSPSHLGRMNTSVDWQLLREGCEAVISSAAPLSRQDSLNVGRLLNTNVREIYGSSETGAIAWRCQQGSHEDALWTPLPEIRLCPTPEGTAMLQSPYLGDIEELVLPDQLVFTAAGNFSLQGRLDSIVKVEGKRLSLLEVERQLLESCWVKQAKALTITRKRVEVAVVLQLSEQGALELQQRGRPALIKAFKSQLATYFEAVLLPRRWRFVQQMPYNPQGKLPLQTLQALFDKEPGKWPKIVSEQVSENQALMECDIPPELIYFDGHFENNPILPGIVQVHWAEAFARRLLPVSGRFQRLEVIKFQQVIVPGTRVNIQLNYDGAKQKLAFEYSSQRGVHSSGRICFG